MAKLLEVMDEKYANREDKNNIYGVGVTNAEFRSFIIDYLLGEDWTVVDPIGKNQVNELALYDILETYSKRYRRECAERKGLKTRLKRWLLEKISKW